ncbi:hypothetical protein N658DRAFT_489243 [Parathielavia hyrcaniae]|uniref:Uncharacterized protein n=1 Tax=Parathielavia hyrcaniae TaxID=113614 RepID=A0AAN6SY86_9PEZI|nr:hypothetical protein N658DRAFT_489243 [Parathielavia hyrcaniae]
MIRLGIWARGPSRARSAHNFGPPRGRSGTALCVFGYLYLARHRAFNPMEEELANERALRLSVKRREDLRDANVGPSRRSQAPVLVPLFTGSRQRRNLETDAPRFDLQGGKGLSTPFRDPFIPDETG